MDQDALYVDEHGVLTSAGSAAGIDAGLHLVREDWGAAVAGVVARRMVMAPHRDGGQAQFADTAPPVDGDGWLPDVQAWAVAHLHEALTLADLAQRAAVSVRTLSRPFAEEVGTSPGAWLAEQRLLRAHELLVATDATVDRVADEVGFGTSGALRDHFRRQLDTTPSVYRRRFSNV